MSESLEVLARRRLSLVEQAEEIRHAIGAIDAQIIEAVEVGGRIDVAGEPVFRVAQRRTFDLGKAMELAPPEVVTAATVPTVDAKALRSMLPPVLVEACMAPGATYVTKATTK